MQVRDGFEAPSKLQRWSGDGVKADARDALHLARLLKVGEITRIPSIDHEAARDLVRAPKRTDGPDVPFPQAGWRFWQRDQSFFSERAITVTQVLTDNGSCYAPAPSLRLLEPVSSTSSPARIAPNNGKGDGITGRCLRNGPKPIVQKWKDSKPFRHGSMITIIAEDTLHSEVNHQPAVFLTS